MKSSICVWHTGPETTLNSTNEEGSKIQIEVFPEGFHKFEELCLL